jgi:hypothetical protein
MKLLTKHIMDDIFAESYAKYNVAIFWPEGIFFCPNQRATMRNDISYCFHIAQSSRA